MSRRTVETGRFQVRDDSGEIHTVVEMTIQTNTTTLDSTEQEWTNTGKSYRTASGDPVNKLSDTEYEIVRARQKARRL